MKSRLVALAAALLLLAPNIAKADWIRPSQK